MRSFSRVLRGLAATALLALMTEACTHASGSDTSARNVSTAFLDAVAKARWKEAGAMLDLEQLESLRKERATAERQRRGARGDLMGIPDMIVACG